MYGSSEFLFGFTINRKFLSHTITTDSLEFSYLKLNSSSESNAKCMINTRNTGKMDTLKR